MTFVHPSALVEEGATIGEGCHIWHQAQVRSGATVGTGCILGKGAFVDAGVSIGASCKIQNYACVYRGTTLEDGVFVGPHAVFTNDRLPRAIDADGTLKDDSAWEVGETIVRNGASIGSRAVILPGLEIGAWALVGAGSVVTRDVAAHALVAGNPARARGWVCTCARTLSPSLVCDYCAIAYCETASGLTESRAVPGGSARGD